MLEGKRILVTGGTGSLGQAMVRRLLGGGVGTPERVVIFSRDEAKQHYMRLSYEQRSASTDELIYENFRRRLQFLIGDIRDYGDVCRALRGIDIVINAAALKQVPTCEYFPAQAVATNIQGPENIVRAIRDLSLPIEAVVGVSTDKACKPVNVMGLTKAIMERVFIAGALQAPTTRFLIVRYGNVLASRGSVIPLFLDQIRHGGPVTITDTAMTRFLISLDEAVDTIFTALREGRTGETYVPTCAAATVPDIAKALIGDRAIATKVTGIRPGEKLHEILISEEEMRHVQKRGQYYAVSAMLPEIATTAVAAVAGASFEYSSRNAVGDFDATRALLARHGLLDAEASKTSQTEDSLR
ncbi:MAG: polysaccharide biosynthesis protein [Candidatus Acidiferrales bacterium]